MAALLGHALMDENRKASGGKAGDSTNREVSTVAWFDSDWNKLLRPLDEAVAVSFPYVAVANTDVNFRSSPSSTSAQNIITALKKEQPLLVVSARADGWTFVKTDVNKVVKSGWIFKDFLDKSVESSLKERKGCVCNSLITQTHPLHTLLYDNPALRVRII